MEEKEYEINLLCEAYERFETLIDLNSDNMLMITQINMDGRDDDVVLIEPILIPKMIKMLQKIHSEYLKTVINIGE